MPSSRLEAFSDGVLAIIITIMVLEMKVPEHSAPEFSALKEIWPVFFAYVLSFVYLGIYWNNHHHMLHAVKTVSGPVLWANLHLLFWLSLIPFSTAWLGEAGIAEATTAVYGGVLLMAAIAFVVLQKAIIRNEGPESHLQVAVGKDWKGKASLAMYALAIGLSFVEPMFSIGIYIGVALVWVVPDRRIERVLLSQQE